MQLVLSLIAAPAKEPLGTADLDLATDTLESVSATPGFPRWLSEGEACDIPFDGLPKPAREAARKAFAGRPVDVNVVAQKFRQKRLLIADMDSTMIRQECIDELAAMVGLRDEVAAITESAMRGEIAFEPALKKRVALLTGLSTGVVEKLLAERIEVTAGARTLIATMRASGAHTVLVSGGFTAFVEPIGRTIGFEETRANRLKSDGSVFEGLVAEPILGAEAKEQALVEVAARLRLRPEETLAVGDGANDAAMIRRAGLGVGFRPKPALRKIADAAIDHGDLTALLFLQGFRREEFAAAG